jgi:nitroreductase
MTDGITISDEITMTNAVIECILSRSAAKYYDPAATLSDDQIRELVRIGTTAPTSGAKRTSGKNRKSPGHHQSAVAAWCRSGLIPRRACATG